MREENPSTSRSEGSKFLDQFREQVIGDGSRDSGVRVRRRLIRDTVADRLSSQPLQSPGALSSPVPLPSGFEVHSGFLLGKRSSPPSSPLGSQDASAVTTQRSQSSFYLLVRHQRITRRVVIAPTLDTTYLSSSRLNTFALQFYSFR